MPLTPHEWAEQDLARVGVKLTEFAEDAFPDPRLKRDLLEAVTTSIRHFEERSGLTIT